jgi:hypothetical protein
MPEENIPKNYEKIRIDSLIVIAKIKYHIYLFFDYLFIKWSSNSGLKENIKFQNMSPTGITRSLWR